MIRTNICHIFLRSFRILKIEILTEWEKLDEAEVGKEVVLDQVLMIADGDKATVGKPTVAGATVVAKVVAQKRLPKIVVFKKKAKTGYTKLQGHRQYVTEIEVVDIKA